MSDITDTSEDIIDNKMKELVIRKKHLNIQKKQERREATRYWKKNRKYGKRGRTGHRRQDKIMLMDRKMKESEKSEIEYFIFIKETKKDKSKWKNHVFSWQKEYEKLL